MNTYGYARVSTDGQTLDAQQAQLQAAGCNVILSEKISGAITDRPELAKALAQLKPGDTLVVTRLDRLARSTRDLLNVLDQINNANAHFRSLSDPWCNTESAHGRLMLVVLGGLAEFERSLILARTGDGRQRAKARGVKFGRPRKLDPQQRSVVLERLRAGETKRSVAASLGVHPTMVGRLAA